MMPKDPKPQTARAANRVLSRGDSSRHAGTAVFQPVATRQTSSALEIRQYDIDNFATIDFMHFYFEN
jgi:hypothetical protein